MFDKTYETIGVGTQITLLFSPTKVAAKFLQKLTPLFPQSIFLLRVAFGLGLEFDQTERKMNYKTKSEDNLNQFVIKAF